MNNNDKRTKNRSFRRGRLVVLQSLLVVIGLSVGCRIVDLQLLNRHFLQNEGDKRSVRYEKIPAHRGVIFDRNGKPLAVSTPVTTIWAVPADLLLAKSSWGDLAQQLDINEETLTKRIAAGKNKNFIYLKRQLTPKHGQKVMALNIAGVHMMEEHRRYYPAGEVTAHLVGLTNIDENGQEGMELGYNDWLQGSPGEVRYLKDRRGQLVKQAELVESAKPGKELMLSIDLDIQYLAHRALKEAVVRHKARAASLVMLDVQTGEVLAMVNYPSYNPNNRSEMEAYKVRNRTVTDVLEPGSTLKPFAVLAALESGRYDKNTPVNTSPGYMYIGRNKVSDLRDYGRLNVTSVLTKSSNIGVTKMVMDIGVDNLLDVLRKAGVGQTTGVDFPGESVGYLPYRDRWSGIEAATLSFGYGLTVTPLQLAQAYMMLGAKGVMRPISLIKRDVVPEGVRIFDEKHISDILDMLGTVVQSGSGRRAKVPSYKVGGKTGTTRKVGENGYSSNRHIGIFAGVAPIGNPRLATVIVIDEPTRGGYYGGLTAAPVFSKVNAGALQVLGVPPEQKEVLTVERLSDSEAGGAG
ncbi:MAG: penicillin-binding transpeptidase domain-containing protein [Candidatus Endonucleobacter sp. (ex Gigantidas childressi)]|nr:penicillin-binding transpeptidase domain-containing protein [Candidatus Endonucleobacter sp. (ex Gigantidas childressi)]